MCIRDSVPAPGGCLSLSRHPAPARGPLPARRPHAHLLDGHHLLEAGQELLDVLPSFVVLVLALVFVVAEPVFLAHVDDLLVGFEAHSEAVEDRVGEDIVGRKCVEVLRTQLILSLSHLHNAKHRVEDRCAGTL